ncbi:Hypothetical protein, putative [Bodo saltans]|uniref:Uncharacterized protein n=1 Tax=Bodo saltans TaxID=75058 RepID=A0A0S4IMR6_BODSA|nr:Hypothetical protein, putative [Bodo saltans]|eukprot:CUE74935.1 Hypothetical protein, putative [Bodo saltans]
MGASPRGNSRGSPRQESATNQLSIVMNVPPAPSRHERANPQQVAGMYRGAATPAPINATYSSISPALPKVHRRRQLVQNMERDRQSAQHTEAAQSARHLPSVPSLMFPSSRSSAPLVPSSVTSPVTSAAPAKSAHRVPIFDGDLAYVRRNVDLFAAVVNNDGASSEQAPPLAKPVRDLVLWEHFRRLRAATAADRFDGSTAVLEETLSAFETFLLHGLGCSERAVRDASITSVYSDHQPRPATSSTSSAAAKSHNMRHDRNDDDLVVEKELGILLYHVCKAGLLHDASSLSRSSPTGSGGGGGTMSNTLLSNEGADDDEVGLLLEGSVARGRVGDDMFASTRRRSSAATVIVSDPSIEIELCSSNVIQPSLNATVTSQQQNLPSWTLGGGQQQRQQQRLQRTPVGTTPTSPDTAVFDRTSGGDSAAAALLLQSSNTNPSTFYDTIRGKDLVQRHPTVQTFKRSLIHSLEDARSMRIAVDVLQQRLNIAQNTIENYQRAYHAITSGGIPMKKILKNGGAGSPGGLRSGRQSTIVGSGGVGIGDGNDSVLSRGRSPIEDSTVTAALRGISPHSQSIQSLHLGGGLQDDFSSPGILTRQTSATYSQASRKRPSSVHQQLMQQQTNSALAAAAISASSSVSAPTPLAVPAIHGGGARGESLKPVALGAAEKLIDELLAQNGTLIERVTDLAAEKATYTSRIVYLERQVEQLNQAVTALSASNFDLAHQYKSSLYRNHSTAAPPSSAFYFGGGGGSSKQHNNNDLGSSAISSEETPLYSPMLLDGRSAEVVAHQSTIEIMKLLGLPFTASPAANTSPGGAGSAHLFLRGDGGGVGAPFVRPHPPTAMAASTGAVFTLSMTAPPSAHPPPPSQPQPHHHFVSGGDALDAAPVSPLWKQNQPSSLTTSTNSGRRKSATFAIIETQ